jgi:hypothetical protein
VGGEQAPSVAVLRVEGKDRLGARRDLVPIEAAERFGSLLQQPVYLTL